MAEDDPRFRGGVADQRGRPDQEPLLLIHGKKDVTVDHVQSAKMYGAMRKAGKAVEFVSIPLADHYFTREADRMTLLTSIEAFLAKHSPPN